MCTPLFQLWSEVDTIGQTVPSSLKDSLKLAKERVNREIQDNQEKQLNPNRGAGGKGACTPRAMLVSANTAKAQN